MIDIRFNIERCKGCKLCIDICPKALIEIDDIVLTNKGYHPAVIKNKDKCIGCGFCATICPDCVIEIL